MNMRELAKQFPWLTKGEIENAVVLQRPKYKTERGFLAYLAKKNEENERVFTMPDVSRIRIDITWKKSRTWGMCPHAEWECWFKDGQYKHGKTSASGYGYDKHSQVIADVFNACCKGMAWRKRNSRKKAPYGIEHVGKGAKKNWCPYFMGGIGSGCYEAIAEFLGGKMESSAGTTWDYHVFIFK